MPRAFILIATLSIILAPGTTTANAGGYSLGAKFTGDVAPFQASGTGSVQILDEKLDIDLTSVEASVRVRYTMTNPAPAPARVKFGFPVESAREEIGYFGEPGTREYGDHRRQMQAQGAHDLIGYSVMLDGERVASTFVIEPFASGKVKPFPGSEALKNVGGWMVSEVTFPASRPVALEIRYRVRHGFGVGCVSDACAMSPRRFSYRLSTGAVWRGPIIKGTVTLTADGIPADEVEIVAPRGRFERDGHAWRWEFNDLKPTVSDDIEVVAVPGYRETPASQQERERGLVSYVERAGVWGVSHQRFKARASSTLATHGEFSYAAGNVASADPKAPWCEGVPGHGEDEWLHLSPLEPRALMGIGICPGVGSCDQRPRGGLFADNGTPVRIRVSLNDDYSFVASLGDQEDRQFIPILGYARPVTEVRLTILDVRPGRKFQDTCISRVLLYDRLGKKPEMDGAR